MTFSQAAMRCEYIYEDRNKQAELTATLLAGQMTEILVASGILKRI